MHKAIKSALMFKPELLEPLRRGSGDLVAEGLPDGQAPSRVTETSLVEGSETVAAVVSYFEISGAKRG